MKCESEVQINGIGANIELLGVFDGEVQAVKTNRLPYGFVERKYESMVVRMPKVVKVRHVNLKNDDGREVVEYDCNTPADVAIVRDELAKRGIKTYEADIPYVRRIFIDKIFDVHYWPERVLWIDLELDDSKGLPAKYGYYKILSAAVSWDGETIEWFDGKDEVNMLTELLRKIYEQKKTVFVGWNVPFDFNHLLERAKIFDIEYTDYLEKFCYALDYRELYKKVQKGLTEYSLAEVANVEQFKPKHRTGKVSDMTMPELKEYNMYDVDLLLQLERKYGYVQSRCRLHEDVGLPLSMDSAYQIGDSLILRRVRELGYVAPTVDRKENANFKGAFVKEPTPGLYKNVAVFDITGLYPTALIETNTDVGHFKGEVLPYIVKSFLREKEEASRKNDKIGRELAKLKSNAIGYGLLGFGAFRYFDAAKAARITERGREKWFEIEKLISKMGLPVLAGDTDSFFTVVEGVGNAQSLAEYINKKIAPYTIKLEDVFDWIIFFKGETKDGGAKKRYAGMSKSGNMKVRGLEIRRGDWCMLTKYVLMEALKMVGAGCSKDDVERFLLHIRNEMYRGRFDEDLKITKSVSEKYKKEPAHARALREAIEKGKIPEDVSEITYIISNGKPVLAESGVKPDYGWYYSHQLLPPIKRLLASIEKQMKLM
jgi:DNA polymerase elongation subunit (family B)